MLLFYQLGLNRLNNSTLKGPFLSPLKIFLLLLVVYVLIGKIFRRSEILHKIGHCLKINLSIPPIPHHFPYHLLMNYYYLNYMCEVLDLTPLLKII